jgi:hypothetical protein
LASHRQSTLALLSGRPLRTLSGGEQRLEVRLREAAGGPAGGPGTDREAEPCLAALPGAGRLGPGRWEIGAPKVQAPALLPRLVDLIGWEALDDFRLLTPTLEDVYAHVAGRRWEGERGER